MLPPAAQLLPPEARLRAGRPREPVRHGRRPQDLAADLRRAFSGIVAGNVKEGGIRAIEKKGPFKLHGDKELMHLMDRLLESFVRQQRMKLPGSQYIPCYEIVK